MKRYVRILLGMLLLCFMSLTIQTKTYAASNVRATIKSITVTEQGVELKWSKCTYAGQYYIYRGTSSKQSSFKLIAKVKAPTLTYKDKSAASQGTYYYKVANKTKSGKSLYQGKSVKVSLKRPTAPTISSVNRGSDSAKVKVTLKTVKGQTYRIYRRSSSEGWTKLKEFKASSSTYTYTDTSSASNTNYGYKAITFKKSGKITTYYSNYSPEVKTLEAQPEVSADITNLRAKLTWDSVEGVTHYYIYRKNNINSSYQLLATTTGTSYIDEYCNSALTIPDSYFCVDTFVDPSINSFVYTVRAVCKSGSNTSYGSYDQDGIFLVESPSIVKVNKTSSTTAEIEWSCLYNAKEYRLSSGKKDSRGRISWTLRSTVKNSRNTRQSASMKVDSDDTYFTVMAVFEQNGSLIESDYDEGFTIQNRNYSNQNILFLGDNITFASPYTSDKTVEVFSYPWRVQQLTGADIYNPSISGATYASSGTSSSRKSIVNDVAGKIRQGGTPVDALHPNSKSFKDFDVVVMACGSNDYSDNVPIGDLGSTDLSQFNGAVNQIMKWIDQGSAQRVAAGKKPIKIVFVELFYSDRTTKPYNKLTNRLVTPNGLGYTLSDYRDNYDKLIRSYKNQGFDVYRYSAEWYVNERTCPYVTSDNLNMSRYTYTQIGNDFTEFLIDRGIIEK